LQPLFERGEIHCKRDIVNSDIMEFELTAFPKGEHEDIIDSLSSVMKFAFAPETVAAKTENDANALWQRWIFEDTDNSSEYEKEEAYDLITRYR